MIVDDFLRYMLQEREASPLTVNTYRDCLADYTAFLNSLDNNLEPENADSDIIRAWVENMMERGQKATYTCKKLSAVKSLYRYALRNHILTKDPAHNICGPKKEKVLPAFLKETDADKLFDEIQWDYNKIHDVRARTLLLLLYTTGIRRAEIVSLRDEDINFITHEMKVTGKRRKQRIIPLGDEIINELQHYVELRDADNTGINNKSNETFFQMSANQVYNTVHQYLSLVTTQKKRSPHVMRHSFATAMLNHNAKLGSVQKLLGHESLDTTQIYTHLTFEELKRSYNKAHPRA